MLTRPLTVTRFHWKEQLAGFFFQLLSTDFYFWGEWCMLVTCESNLKSWTEKLWKEKWWERLKNYYFSTFETNFNFTVSEHLDNGKTDMNYNYILFWRKEIKCSFLFYKSSFIVIWNLFIILCVCVCTRVHVYVGVEMGSVYRSRCFLRGCVALSAVFGMGYTLCSL